MGLERPIFNIINEGTDIPPASPPAHPLKAPIPACVQPIEPNGQTTQGKLAEMAYYEWEAKGSPWQADEGKNQDWAAACRIAEDEARRSVPLGFVQYNLESISEK